MQIEFQGAKTKFSGTLNFAVQRRLSDELKLHTENLMEDVCANSVFADFFFNGQMVYEAVKLVTGKDDEFLGQELTPKNIWACRSVLMQGFINFSAPEIRPAIVEIVQVLERDGLKALPTLQSLMQKHLEDSIGTTSEPLPGT